MKEGGLDEVLANHFGHLFIRDPLVIFEESLEEEDEEGTDHFEVPPSSLFLQRGTNGRNRIFNLRIGKRFALNLPPRNLVLGGE